MKKIFTFSLLLFVLTLGAVAQNQYWNYQSQNIATNPTSTVSIVHSNGNIYFFQADIINSTLTATEINAISMLPTGVDKGLSTYSGLTLEGGFEDVNGDFVLYGYRDMGNYQWHPFYMIIGHTFSLNYWYNSNLIGRFVRGCSGYDTNSNPAYLFVMDDGRLFVAEPNSTNNNHLVTQGEGYPYQDISWDGTHQLFIASGSHPAPQGLFSPGPFVELLEVDLSLVPNPVTTPVFHYNIHDQIVLGGGENKTLHAQIDNDHLILFHDLRKDSVDIVWLTLVRNYSTYNPYIFNSRHFQFPAHKLFAKDMVYDNLNNRLNLLTELMYCNENAMPQQLSQVNPYSLTGMRVIQLDGGYGVNAPCPSMADPNISFYGTLLDMNRLSFNHHNHCGPVLVSGVHYSSASILTETYDVSASACDTKLTIWESNDDPILFSQYSSPTASHISMTDIQAGFSNDYISVNTPCLDPNACSNQRANQSKGPHFMDTQTEAGVTVLDNRRVICNGFNGETTICMYDLTGKMMWCTSTFNELQNTFPTLNGLYILVAMDVWGNQVVCKVLFP